MTWRWFLTRVGGLSARSRFAQVLARTKADEPTITDPEAAAAAIKAHVRG